MNKAIQRLMVSASALGIAVSASGCGVPETEVVTITGPTKYVTRVETKTVTAPAPPPKPLPQVCKDAIKVAEDIQEMSADLNELAYQIHLSATEMPGAAFMDDHALMNELQQELNDNKRELGRISVDVQSARKTLDSLNQQCKEETNG